ncbi:MAG TPA: pitrilysin family protein [Mycobacteriales bacterium]|nr:pitrilysin family protein [Mycobacteriales bacterium]
MTTLVAERPEPAPPRPWRFPSFERRTVAGGPVIACDVPGRPLAMVLLVLDAGAVTEPAGKEGVALLLARALSEGTRTKSAYEFAVAGERLGANWRADTDWDAMRCGFEVPAGELQAAADLLAEAVRDPGLDDETLLRVRDERLDEVRLELSQPGPRAGMAFVDAVFSSDSRYAVRDGGDLTTVAALTPDDVRAFHAARFAPDAATLVVVGDLAGTDVDALGRSVFEGWTGTATPVAPPVVSTRGENKRIILVDRPGSVQSMLYSGHDAPARAVEDYVPMTTMALSLGGMFSSRLMYRLREDKGYTYGAYGGYDCRRHGGVFVARAAVHTEVTAPALADTVAEIRRMHDDGLEEDELDLARRYRSGIFPINFAGSPAVAAGLSDLIVHGFPDDHFDRLRAQIEAVTTDEVNTAAQKRLRPDDLVNVVVGDASVVAESLGEIGLGPVQVVTDEA